MGVESCGFTPDAMLHSGEPVNQETVIEPGSGNVFADLGFPDAEEHLARAKLVLAISRTI